MQVGVGRQASASGATKAEASPNVRIEPASKFAADASQRFIDVVMNPEY